MQEIGSATNSLNQIAEKRSLFHAEKSVAIKEMEDLFFLMRIGRLGPTLLAGEVVIPRDQFNSVLEKINSLQRKSKITMGIEAQVICNRSNIF